MNYGLVPNLGFELPSERAPSKLSENQNIGRQNLIYRTNSHNEGDLALNRAVQYSLIVVLALNTIYISQVPS